MPEVEALARYLGERMSDRTVERVELGAFSALKTFDPPLDRLDGRTVSTVGRRGKYLLVELGDGTPLWLVVHLARAGWVHWRDQMSEGRIRQGRGPLALRIRLRGGGGADLTEAGTEKRLAVWVVGEPDSVEGISRLGPEPLDPAFDAASLAKVLAGCGQNLKGALTDQGLLAGIGNAYSDEILNVAKMSPFKMASKLSQAEVETLHRAMTDVLQDAVNRATGLADKELKADKKGGMRVHGRSGKKCPECGEVVRDVSFSNHSLQYCPTCQTGGKVLADRRLSRLLK